MIIGHLLIPVLACELNDIPPPPFGSWVFNTLLLARSHIYLEYADIDCDVKEGKRTIAVVLGKPKSLTLVIALTVLESLSGFLILESVTLGLFSLFGIVVFLKAASDGSAGKEKTGVSISQSVVGAALMVFLWRSRTFTAR